MHSDWMSRYSLLMFNELDSTNSEAKKLASSRPIGNFVICAKTQLAGRGRAGRQWESKTGNLYMSILLSSEESIEDQAQLSFVAALSVMDAILERRSGAIDIKLKWPNDVLISEKKISGILLESVRAGDAHYIIIGIGVNLSNHPELEDKPATSMQALGLKYESPEQILNLVMSSFEKYYGIWHGGYGCAKIRELWLTKAYKLKEAITVSDGKQRISGVFEGIDQSGSMVLRLASGQTCTMSACEIFFGAGA